MAFTGPHSWIDQGQPVLEGQASLEASVNATLKDIYVL